MKILFYLDIFITVIFVVELVFKVIAFGLIFNGKTSYLRCFSNMLDFSIVLFSIFGIFNGTYMVFKVFRILRVLRPLKIIVRS